jgi:hypothetical protein
LCHITIRNLNISYYYLKTTVENRNAAILELLIKDEKINSEIKTPSQLSLIATRNNDLDCYEILFDKYKSNNPEDDCVDDLEEACSLNCKAIVEFLTENVYYEAKVRKHLIHPYNIEKVLKYYRRERFNE